MLLTNFWIHYLLPVEAANHHRDNQIPDAFITRQLHKFDVGRGLALTQPLPPWPGLGPQGRGGLCAEPSPTMLTQSQDWLGCSALQGTGSFSCQCFCVPREGNPSPQPLARPCGPLPRRKETLGTVHSLAWSE